MRSGSLMAKRLRRLTSLRTTTETLSELAKVHGWHLLQFDDRPTKELGRLSRRTRPPPRGTYLRPKVGVIEQAPGDGLGSAPNSLCSKPRGSSTPNDLGQGVQDLTF